MVQKDRFLLTPLHLSSQSLVLFPLKSYWWEREQENHEKEEKNRDKIDDFLFILFPVFLIVLFINRILMRMRLMVSWGKKKIIMKKESTGGVIY